jgi:hypothetical protein
VLDHVFGGCWYDHLDRRKGAAYRQLGDAQLAEAVRLAGVIDEGGPVVIGPMNRQSLVWRGKT